MGRNETSPIRGYWRANATSTNYIACFNDEACLGGDENEYFPIGRCKEGYRGILCADCDDRYFRNGAFECGECPSLIVNIMVLVLTTFFVTGTIIVLVNSMMQLPVTRKPIYAVYIKILLNHL